MLNPFVLNGVLTTVGLLDSNATINWLGDPRTSLLSVTLVNVWRSFPFPMVMFLAGLAAIPDELYEASAIDGCGAARQLRYVTLPSLRGVLATVALLDFIWTFRAFDLVFVMTGGGPINSSQVLATSIYFDAFQKFQFGYSSAEAVAMLVLLMVGRRLPSPAVPPGRRSAGAEGGRDEHGVPRPLRPPRPRYGSHAVSDRRMTTVSVSRASRS